MKKYIIPLLIICLLCSCRPEPYDDSISYTIKNSSTHNIELLIFFKDANNYNRDTVFLIAKEKEIVRHYTNVDLDCPFALNYDSVYMNFDDIKRLTYRRNDSLSRNILNTANYEGGLVKDYWLYEYYYIITDEDYTNAVEIK